MASSSSANKIAKLAQKGKGKKVRFQGGTVFPLIIVIVVVLLGSLIVYARQSRLGPGQGAPTANDHWHAAMGFYVCDANGLKTEPNLLGALEETGPDGQLISQGYIRTGVHSHSDGVMHWHAIATGKATGTNARLKVFLSNYDVTLTNTKLEFPASQGGEKFEEGKSKCVIDGKEKTASLKLWVWDDYSKVTTEDPQVYITDMGDVRIKNDGMVFMVAFVPDDVKPKAPETAYNLPELGAADTGGVAATSTTVAGVPTDSTATTVLGATSDTATGSSTDGSTVSSVGGEPSATTTKSSTATTVKSSTTTTGG